ncbi:MAG: DUF192 domain-containing protein [Candidatus Schekmanbacteria bacterium]|nr:DUF192 domain-containing protein [Candidatus Schekmanbacteria bacterium]
MGKSLPVVRIRHAASGAIIVPRAEKAATVFSRMRGLLGRSSLAEGDGMWIIPCPSIHTVRMRFEIDAVFLDSAFRVTRVCPGLAPGRWHVGGGKGARSVIELPAGAAARHALAVGDELAMEELP